MARTLINRLSDPRIKTLRRRKRIRHVKRGIGRTVLSINRLNLLLCKKKDLATFYDRMVFENDCNRSSDFQSSSGHPNAIQSPSDFAEVT